VPLLSVPAAARARTARTGSATSRTRSFLIPPAAGLLWVGPVVQLRTASNDRLGTGKWAPVRPWSPCCSPIPGRSGAGDAALVILPATTSGAKVNQTQIQPVLSYRLRRDTQRRLQRHATATGKPIARASAGPCRSA
jgi:hypothetical protein